MDQLYDEVKKSLDGLVIPPLQNIINEFLPDRALLESYHLIDIARDNGGKITITRKNELNGRVWLPDLRGGGAGADFAPSKFDEFTLDFTPFLPFTRLDRPDWPPYFVATIIYHGEPEIIQIERRPGDKIYYHQTYDVKPDKVWTNSMIQSNKPLMAL